MINDIVDSLISAGILNHFLDRWENIRIKLRPKLEPKSVGIGDLAFCFYIWIIFCAVSVIALIAELILGIEIFRKNMSFEILWKKFKYRRVKFAKVHQNYIMFHQTCMEDQQLTSNLCEKFVVDKKIEKKSKTFLTLITELNLIKKVVNSEKHLQVFGEKVENIEEDVLGSSVLDDPFHNFDIA
jgi:hypothetical protein